LDSLAEALRSGDVRSAVLAEDSLIERVPWAAVERAGALVVEKHLILFLDPDSRRWVEVAPSPSLVADHLGDGRLTILRPARVASEQDRQVVETAQEFAASLDGDRPVVVRTTLAAVEQNRRAWFGELADARVGGANALLALSGVTSQSTAIVLRNAAALSLSRVYDGDALSTHVRAGRIGALRCLGFTRSRIVAEHLPDEAVAMISGPGGYAIYVELAAVIDPEVEIDAGLIFEQATLNDVQTLATAERRRVTVNVGPANPVAVSAWCLNSALAPPNGESMNVTPLRYVTNSTSQRAIWAERDSVIDAS
jgi:hypothetical protein